MIDPTLYEGYVGHNMAHRTFKVSIVNAKVLFFLFQSNRSILKDSFLRQLDAVHPEKGSFGLFTENLSPTEFRLLNIPHNEAVMAASNFEEFETHAYASMYSRIHQILNAFLVELYGEIARLDPRIMKSVKTVTYVEILDASDVVSLLILKRIEELSHMDRASLEGEFERIGLPIIPIDGVAPDVKTFLAREFAILWSTRNILEHNHGIVNQLFMKKCPEAARSLGESIMIDVPMLGRAFGA